MQLSRAAARWKLYFRTRRRCLRLLLMTVTAAGSLLVLAALDLPTAPLAEPAAQRGPPTGCGRGRRNAPDLDLTAVFPTLNFSAAWTRKKTFWNKDMEKRFQNIKKKPPFPLKIMVVPHSHNDPGWGWTVVDYYRTRTRNVLDSIVAMMPQLPLMRFMWTEIVFLQLWWQDASAEQRRTFRQLTESGRLEITTGGWVMTDEAVARLYPMVDQLTEGHRWLRHHLNVTVKTGWSVDPFGHGSTMPYILRQAGIKQAVIMRTPYVWKEYLAAHQSGDFIWQQQWDQDGSSSLLTHHHPYFMYTTSAACGPFGESTQMCFNFDFARDWSNPVPWYSQFTHVTDANIKERAEMLVDSAGRTASLFPHNVALMMLGADFQFKHDFEWREQYSNYTKLMEYINSRPELNAQIQFASPAEYFSAVRQRSRRRRRLPTLTGDFHVYSDVFNAKPKYWSGYYTTLPHWKRAARQLEAQLRGADILYAWAWSQQREAKAIAAVMNPFHHSYNRLVMSRQDVALFNHHDAITGTSSTAVMSDYIERLSISAVDLHRASLLAIASLLLELGMQSRATELFDKYAPVQRGLGVPPQLVEFAPQPGGSHRLLLYNPLAQERVELVEFAVTSPHVAVRDTAGRPVPVSLQAHGQAFRARLLARLLPLAVHVFRVVGVAPPEAPRQAAAGPAAAAADEAGDVDDGDAFTISNDRFELTFNRSGFLWSALDRRVGRTLPLQVSFGAFDTVPQESGKYLFATAAAAPRPLPCPRRRWTVRRDATAAEASVDCGRVRLTARLPRADAPIGQAVHLQVETRLSSADDETDVFMQLRTGVASCAPRGCGFYSDASDYQMVWRPFVAAAGVAGNVYPVTTQASLQDERLRVSLLMDHSRGVASLEEGTLTAMLDRRSRYDDDRGIGEGNQANRPVLASFMVTFDHLVAAPAAGELFANGPLTAALSRQLNHPPQAFLGRDTDQPKVQGPLRLLDGPLPCDWELVTLRQLSDRTRYEYPGRRVQVTLLRRRLDCRLWDERDGLRCRPGAAAAAEFSPFIALEGFEATGLTGGWRPASAAPLRGLRDVRLRPDELRTFELSYRRPGMDSVEDVVDLDDLRRLNGLDSKESEDRGNL